MPRTATPKWFCHLCNMHFIGTTLTEVGHHMDAHEHGDTEWGSIMTFLDQARSDIDGAACSK